MGSREFILKKEEEGMRIDKIIQDRFTDISRSKIQRLIEENKITLNENPLKASYKGKQGDIVHIDEEEPTEILLKPEDIDLDVLYEDNDIIVINKQKGMVVHPGNGNPDGTLVNAVLSRCKGSLSGIGGKIRPRYCS